MKKLITLVICLASSLAFAANQDASNNTNMPVKSTNNKVIMVRPSAPQPAPAKPHVITTQHKTKHHTVKKSKHTQSAKAQKAQTKKSSKQHKRKSH